MVLITEPIAVSLCTIVLPKDDVVVCTVTLEQVAFTLYEANDNNSINKYMRFIIYSFVIKILFTDINGCDYAIFRFHSRQGVTEAALFINFFAPNDL